jgi:hypothetical protein
MPQLETQPRASRRPEQRRLNVAALKPGRPIGDTAGRRGTTNVALRRRPMVELPERRPPCWKAGDCRR